MLEFNFTGKSTISGHHHSVNLKPLIIKNDKSSNKNTSLKDNLIIHGDNLEALKSLLPLYAGKIKCVYIDPPYNTGNEGWKYNDNVNDKRIKDWLHEVVQTTHMDRHDRWLCMMYPRLTLLRDLLRDDGILFVSIDDHEDANLKKILDEIFGESNFMAKMIWNTEGATDNQLEIKVIHEYVYCYIKNIKLKNSAISNIIDPDTPKTSKVYNGYIENSIIKNGEGNPFTKITIPIGFPCEVAKLKIKKHIIDNFFYNRINKLGYIPRTVTKKYNVKYPILHDDIVVNNKFLTKPCSVTSGWANLNKLKKFIDNNCKKITDNDGAKVEFYLSKNGVIIYKKERIDERHIISVIRNAGTTNVARHKLEKDGIDFQYPKPVELIKYLIRIGSNNNDIILDSFAGSGTTGHAVLEINAEYNDDRKFILIECEDYAHDITAKRIDNTIKKMNDTVQNTASKNVVDKSYTYCELGKPITIENMLKGKELPSYGTLQSYIVQTVTGNAPKKIINKPNSNWSIHESPENIYFLIYENNVDFLKNSRSALNNKTSLKISRICKMKKKHGIVYATTRTMTQSSLHKMRIHHLTIPFDIRGI